MNDSLLLLTNFKSFIIDCIRDAATDIFIWIDKEITKSVYIQKQKTYTNSKDLI